MCMGQKTPTPAAALPEAAAAPELATGGSADSADARRRRAASGQSGTVLTGSRGIENASGAGGKTLLGG